MDQQIKTEEFIQALEKFGEALFDFGKALVKALKPVMKAIKEFCDKVWEFLWQAYRDAGMPYGETDDGLLHWWKDLCEISRTKAALKREISWEEAIGRLRFCDNN